MTVNRIIRRLHWILMPLILHPAHFFRMTLKTQRNRWFMDLFQQINSKSLLISLKSISCKGSFQVFKSQVMMTVLLQWQLQGKTGFYSYYSQKHVYFTSIKSNMNEYIYIYIYIVQQHNRLLLINNHLLHHLPVLHHQLDHLFLMIHFLPMILIWSKYY